MSTQITNAALVAACKQMLTEGITYAEMDCQAAIEEALMRCGVPRKECDLGGSNAHYRRCLWRGTPERLLDLLGAKEVPAGFFMFIVLASGEPAKYQGDGYGNADHIGIYMGDGQTFNSSSSRGGVETSTKFGGKKAVPNGGWNMVGWSEWVDCGLTEAQAAALKSDGNYTGAADTEAQPTPEPVEATTATTDVDTSGFYPVKKGCKGGAVERLQNWLNDLGYDLKVDHDFGALTDTAVRDFQGKNGLQVDGYVGKLTWAALASARKTAMEDTRA